MADQTQGAVDSLVGLLTSTIKGEAKLLGGVQGDMQFIKDEMDSMNGFLLHLTKTDEVHDDQLRAWMKQVQEVAYIAQDCIHRYKRVFAGWPTDKGVRALIGHLPTLLKSLPARHRLANKISELKVRVHNVGERRMRYDVQVPHAAHKPQQVPPDGPTDTEREDFLRALERDKNNKAKSMSKEEEASYFDEAIGLLPKDLQSAATTVRAGLIHKCLLAGDFVICMELLLRALRAHSKVRGIMAKTWKKLEQLVQEEEDGVNLPHHVKVFCYSKLSRSYKSCLQYLSAFRKETAISRRSLVRRWLAEGLVEKQDNRSLEESAELCFEDLLFRGFLRPQGRGATGKVTSCILDETMWEFVDSMSATENFLNDLPTHLQNQLRIRKFVLRQQELEQRNINMPPRLSSICGLCRPTRPLDDTEAEDDPLDGMVKFLINLSDVYRLNVLDLGGCRGLNLSHLQSICNVLSIKYLSLRETGVSRLPSQINNLDLLETLDIRETNVRDDTRHINLPKLKHFLAGSPTTTSISQGGVKEPLCPWMPHNIGRMREMEILSRFQVRQGRAAARQQLEEVGRLRQLRKLGVVLTGRKEAQENMKHLLGAVIKLNSKCLRSLAVWITPPSTNGDLPVPMLLNSEHHEPLSLESLDISGLGNTELPSWSWILELKQLYEITVCDTLLSIESLHALGNNLHCLRSLRLRRNSYNQRSLTFNKDGFKDLRFLIIEGDTVTTVHFEEDGATPMLKRIVWCNMPIHGAFDTTNAGTLSGIRHLPRLEEVKLKGHFSCIEESPGVRTEVSAIYDQ